MNYNDISYNPIDASNNGLVNYSDINPGWTHKAEPQLNECEAISYIVTNPGNE